MMFNQMLVRVRAGTATDRGGNTVPDWSPGAVDRLTVGNVNIQPSLQAERADEQRTAVVAAWRVQSAPGTAPDIRAIDRIEWDGMLLEVDGEVARWPQLFTDAVHHIQFDMRRATG